MDIEPGPILYGTELNMHHGTYAANQACLMWQTELGFNLYFEPVLQLTWIGSKYSVQPGSILYVEPVVMFAYRRA